MLGSSPFYHGITRKLIVAFGQIFSDIKIQRTNANGVVEQLIDVPISYGNREKWYQRLKEEPTLDQRVLVSLPRIGFEIVGFQYDAARKLNKMTQYRKCGVDANGNAITSFLPVPYNITFNLYVMTKTQDDMFQIVEQIIPFFAPQYTLSLIISPELEMTQSVPITIEGLNISDSYEGAMETRREVIATLTFNVKAEYLGAVNSNTGVITSVITKLDPQSGETAREVDVSADGTPSNYVVVEEKFDIPRPI